MKAYIIYPYYNNKGNGPSIEGYTDVIKANNRCSELNDWINRKPEIGSDVESLIRFESWQDEEDFNIPMFCDSFVVEGVEIIE